MNVKKRKSVVKESKEEKIPEWAKDFNYNCLPIPFGRSCANQMVNRDAISHVSGTLRHLWPQCVDEFPGALAVSIMRDQLPQLNREYLLLEKTDGTRFMMFFIMMGKTPRIFLFNRSWTMYEIFGIRCHRKVYEGTLFDGEMVFSNGKYRFIVFDCVLESGNLISRTDWKTRTECAKQLLLNDIQAPYDEKNSFGYKQSPFEISVKDPVDVSRLCSDVQTTSSDGFILIKNSNPYKSGKDSTLFKYKFSTQHTIDLAVVRELREMTPRYQFKYWIPERKKYETLFEMSSQEIPIDLLPAIEEGGHCIVECGRDMITNKYFVIKPRFDKKQANNEFTVMNTIKNIEENISNYEIFQHLIRECDRSKEIRVIN